MYYNVKELRNNLAGKILGLGINSRFVDNPAYASAVAAIESLINQMNMMGEEYNVMVYEQNGTISFKWNSKVSNSKYSFTISSPNPNSFVCVKTEEREKIGHGGELFGEKEAVEIIANYNESNGSMSLTTNVATANDINRKKDCCDIVDNLDTIALSDSLK